LDVLDSISIENLSFRFAGRSELLTNINMRIEKGKFVAVVGESGSGKSTLGQILQRFYPFEKGNIIVNNELDFNEIALKSYRNLIGVIPQEINIFNGNVVENILLGQPDTPENFKAFFNRIWF
jgi:ATP-binding cassette subfamily B protein